MIHNWKATAHIVYAGNTDTRIATAATVGTQGNDIARMIAAAPDLLQALEGLIDAMPAPGTRKLTVAWDIARAAIAKAKGQGA